MSENFSRLPKTRAEAKDAGAAFYFPGTTCIHGHISKKQTSNGYCYACYRLKHKPKSEINQRIYSDKERLQRQKNRSRRWYEKNRRLCIDRSADWKRKNRDRVRASEARERKKPKRKAISFMRDSLRRVLKTEKNGRTESILGYSRRELVTHLERQFIGSMSWDNHGELWEIDHIIPISKMLDEGEKDPAKINCLTNLRPLKKDRNRDKGNKIENLI